MTPEALLYSAVSGLCAVVYFLFRLLWKEVSDCKVDRLELRKRVEHLEAANGLSEGTLALFKQCNTPSCPFKPQTVTVIKRPQPTQPLQ